MQTDSGSDVNVNNINRRVPQTGYTNFTKQSKDKGQANWHRIYPRLEYNKGEISCSICVIFIIYGEFPPILKKISLGNEYI